MDNNHPPTCFVKTIHEICCLNKPLNTVCCFLIKLCQKQAADNQSANNQCFSESLFHIFGNTWQAHFEMIHTKPILFLILFLLLLTPEASAQRIYDNNGRLSGRVDANSYYDSSGRLIGRVDNDRIYDGRGRIIGRIDDNRLYDGSGRLIGRTSGNQLYDGRGRNIGRIRGNMVYDGRGRFIARADGLTNREIVLFFYFFR